MSDRFIHKPGPIQRASNAPERGRMTNMHDTPEQSEREEVSQDATTQREALQDMIIADMTPETAKRIAEREMQKKFQQMYVDLKHTWTHPFGKQAIPVPLHDLQKRHSDPRYAPVTTLQFHALEVREWRKETFPDFPDNTPLSAQYRFLKDMHAKVQEQKEFLTLLSNTEFMLNSFVESCDIGQKGAAYNKEHFDSALSKEADQLVEQYFSDLKQSALHTKKVLGEAVESTVSTAEKIKMIQLRLSALRHEREDHTHLHRAYGYANTEFEAIVQNMNRFEMGLLSLDSAMQVASNVVPYGSAAYSIPKNTVNYLFNTQSLAESVVSSSLDTLHIQKVPGVRTLLRSEGKLVAAEALRSAASLIKMTAKEKAGILLQSATEELMREVAKDPRAILRRRTNKT